MTAWDTCTVCLKFTASGYIVCNSCAAKIIEDKRRAGVPIHRVVIDGQTVTVPADGIEAKHLKRIGGDKPLCPVCILPTRVDTLGHIYCRNCGYSNVGTD